MLRNSAICLILIGVAFVPVAYASDWPTYLHDISRSGTTADSLTFPLQQQWVFTPLNAPAKGWGEGENQTIWQSDVVKGQPAIPMLQAVRYDEAYHATAVGNYVYFSASGENKVYCIDADAATIKWVFCTNAPPRCAPTIDNGKAYFGADDGYLYCVNASDGTLVWRFNTTPSGTRASSQSRLISLWPVRTGVVVDSGKVYVASGVWGNQGLYLFAVDSATGAQVWVNNTVATNLGGNIGSRAGNISAQGYLAANATEIYVPGGRMMPAVYNRSTGAVKYQITDGRTGPNGGSYMTLSPGYVYNGANALAAYDTVNLSADQWGHTLYGPIVWCWGKTRSLVVNGSTVYMTNDTDVFCIPQNQIFAAAGKGWGFDTRTAPDWTKCTWRTQGVNVPDALIQAGSTLIAGGLNKVTAFNAATGSQVWTATVDGTARGLSVANGRLLVSTTTGKVYSFAASGNNTTITPPSSSSNPYPTDSYSSFYSQTADSIVSSAGLNSSSVGYCVIVAGESGRLAYEIAKRTNMTIYALETDAAKVAAAKTALHSVGLWGRVTVEQVSSYASLAAPWFSANLLIDEEGFFGGSMTLTGQEITRVLRPCGGNAYIGQPAGGAALGTALSASTVQTILRNLGSSCTQSMAGAWAAINRGMLTGATNWTHQTGDAGNTMCSQDALVTGQMDVLWFGDPGTREEMDRHAGPPGVLVTNGLMLHEGNNVVDVYDAYNGTFLWQRSITGAYREDMTNNPSNIASDTNGNFFLALTDTSGNCYRLDARTGTTLQTYTMPAGSGSRRWGWLAVDGNTLYGSRSDSSGTTGTSECIFAMNITTGALLWKYPASGTSAGMQNISMTLGDGKVYVLDKNMTQAQKDQATAERIAEQGNYVDNLGNPITPDPRLLVAINASTGAVVWTHPRDTCDCSVSSGVPMTIYKDKTVLVCGTPSSEDHNLDPYAAGNFARRSIGAFDTVAGVKLWGGGKNYQTRPMIVGSYIYAEPWFLNLRTGANILTSTGSNMQNFRGYNGNCGGSVASFDTLFNRGVGGVLSYYNVPLASGIQATEQGARVGCWPGYAPANGLVVAPEGGSQCTCPYAIQSSFALKWKSLPIEQSGTRVVTAAVFYNGSAWDGKDEAANAADDNAIATDKQALLPGHTAVLVNYTSYYKGINGVVVDIQPADGITIAPAKADFTCKVGNSNTPSSWTSKNTFTVTVRPGAGVGGSTRVMLTFADGYVQRTWLQVTVKAGAGTGLASDYVFYYGNAIGETGNSSSSARVESGDFTTILADPHKTFANPAPITDMCDFNRDKKVDSADQVIYRSNITTITNELKLISVP